MSKYLTDQWNKAVDEMQDFFAEMDAKKAPAPEDNPIGKYVRVTLTGKFGTVTGKYSLDTINGPETWYTITLNDFTTTAAKLEDFKIIY